MYCNNCGTQNPDGVKFCSNCGGQLLNASAQTASVQPEYSAAPAQPNASYAVTQPEKKKNGKLIGIIVGVAVVVIVAVIAVVLALGSGKKSLDTDIIGTWENVMVEEMTTGYEFSMYTYMEFDSDGVYEIYLDKEKTYDSVSKTLNEYIEEEATNSSVSFNAMLVAMGYNSVDEMIDDVFDIDGMAAAVNYNGYWEIENGSLYDLSVPGNREYADVLDYSISEDGNTLELDGLTWTKVN